MTDRAFATLAAEHPELALRAGGLDANGLRLHVVEAGPESGQPVVLLHGFPEFWWGWRRQIPALAAAGHRVIAPDLPGFHRSAKPRGLAAYGLDALAEGLAALLAEISPAPVAVIGHDWGGALAWWGAFRFPERFSRLAILNCPEPRVARRALLHSRDQRRRAAYVFYFQLPWLPERKLRAGGCRAVRSVFKRSSRPGTFSAAELDVYAEAAAEPGAVRGMLAWYRAALWRPPRRPERSRIEPPLLLLWGLEDVALGRDLVAPSAARCRSAEVVEIPGAGHWVHHEAADEVNRRLVDFLAQG